MPSYLPIIPMINGTSYDWASVTIIILGKPIIGITEIEYEQKQSMELNYGAGAFAISRGFGNFEHTGKITIYQEEWRNIISLVPSGRISDIPDFDIVVSYTPENPLYFTVDTLKSVRFKGSGKNTLKQDDKGLKVEIELSIPYIEYGGLVA